MARITFRRHLSMPGLLRTVRSHFNSIPDTVEHREFSLTDCLMSGLAVIVLKFPSLLRFDQKMRGGGSPAEADNLKSLFGVARPPCDSGLRKRLDRVDVREIRGCFKALFAQLQRGKALERFTVLGGHHLVSLDGTEFYCSGKVRCDACCERRRGGTVSYYHQMLGAALVHPDTNTVFPLAPEMILRQDGADKNDCERNAAARFIRDFRREHPHLKTIILQDGLASNGPHIKLLRSRNLRFIIGAKPKTTNSCSNGWRTALASVSAKRRRNPRRASSATASAG